MDLSHCKKINLYSVHHITSRNPSLTKINLANCALLFSKKKLFQTKNPFTLITPSLTDFNLSLTNLTDQAVFSIFSSPSAALTTLNLSNNASITDKSLSFIFQSFPHLQNLSLNGLWNISDASFDFSLLDKPPSSLKKINLSATNIGDNTIINLGAHCFEVTELILDGCDSISDYCWETLSKKVAEMSGKLLIFPRLETLQMAGAMPKLTQTGYTEMIKLIGGRFSRSLRKLYLSGPKPLDDTFCQFLSLTMNVSNNGLRNLETLSLDENRLVTSQGLTVLFMGVKKKGSVRRPEWTKLKSLSLRDCVSIQEGGIGDIVKGVGSTLKYLNLRGCTAVAQPVIQKLKGLEKIETLDLSGIHSFNNEDLIDLVLEQSMPELKLLKVEDCSGISKSGWQQICRLLLEINKPLDVKWK